MGGEQTPASKLQGVHMRSKACTKRGQGETHSKGRGGKIARQKKTQFVKKRSLTSTT